MAKLSPFQLPEMKRVPLDELCLQVRLLKLGSIRYAIAILEMRFDLFCCLFARSLRNLCLLFLTHNDLWMRRDFMSRALEPPSVEAIAHSIFSLKELGALDANENLTALGYHLAQLPVSGRLGKMMLFGCMFQVRFVALLCMSFLINSLTHPNM
jgi:HrpA-like RNA helicase